MHATAFAVTYALKSNNQGTTKASRSLLLRILFAGLLICLFSQAPVAFADQANVFIYHRFNDSRYPTTNISQQDFQSHLELLHQSEFSVMTLGQVVNRLQLGKTLPQRCAVITVDDAYRSFLDDGWPLLKKYGYPVTLFVSTDAVGGGDFLTWQELRTLQDEGVEIGNHSASHAFLVDRLKYENDAEWTSRVLEDLRRSQQAFRKHLGSSPELFAYPYGEFMPELVAVVREAGFVAAFGQQSGVITADQDFFQLPRFPVGGVYAALSGFRSKLFMKHLPVSVESPKSTIVTGENPPKLKFYLSHPDVDKNTLRCYANGGPDCVISPLDEAGRYEAVALQPVAGRRGKYTLSASDVRGEKWYWYSQLWVRPRGVKMTDHLVPR